MNILPVKMVKHSPITNTITRNKFKINVKRHIKEMY